MSESQALAGRVLRAEADAVLNVLKQLDGRFDLAVELIGACSGTVIVCGMGKSGVIAQKISATLASTGTPSHYLHPTEAMHGDLGRIRGGDVLVFLSYSGTTEDVLAMAALVRQDGVKSIGVTSVAESHLGRLVDVCLPIGDVEEACPHNLAPTASTTAMLALGDALALCVSQHREFSAEDFHRRHPGGTLGRKMLPVMDILRFRVGENLPLIRDTVNVRQMLEEAAEYPRRAGAVLLVDESGRLTGIFTDADLRRHVVATGDGGLETLVADLMTKSPKALDDEALVRDAVQLVREMRLDEIPVVDGAGKPVGLIDVQDLISLKVIHE